MSADLKQNGRLGIMNNEWMNVLTKREEEEVGDHEWMNEWMSWQREKKNKLGIRNEWMNVLTKREEEGEVWGSGMNEFVHKGRQEKIWGSGFLERDREIAWLINWFGATVKRKKVV